MSRIIPFLPSDTNYTLSCPVDETQVSFAVRWNSTEQAYYFDMYESDGTIIVLNVKVIVGMPLGRRSKHKFFDTYKMLAVDTTNKGTDPGFDDLNTRVLVYLES